MEFLHAQNDSTKQVEALRINWYYRPKDIGKKINDTRVLFATMHSDTSPLHSLRGKCQIRHKAEIENMEAYRKTPDCFWFEKLYDRYIQKYYEVIPCFQIVNVPERVKKVLDERWKYIIVEQGRSKEFTSAVKLCKRCGGYCARYVHILTCDMEPRSNPCHFFLPLFSFFSFLHFFFISLFVFPTLGSWQVGAGWGPARRHKTHPSATFHSTGSGPSINYAGLRTQPDQPDR